jgi:hypothetical protein
VTLPIIERLLALAERARKAEHSFYLAKGDSEFLGCTTQLAFPTRESAEFTSAANRALPAMLAVVKAAVRLADSMRGDTPRTEEEYNLQVETDREFFSAIETLSKIE